MLEKVIVIVMLLYLFELHFDEKMRLKNMKIHLLRYSILCSLKSSNNYWVANIKVETFKSYLLGAFVKFSLHLLRIR